MTSLFNQLMSLFAGLFNFYRLDFIILFTLTYGVSMLLFNIIRGGQSFRR